jgi:hypothetical protein
VWSLAGLAACVEVGNGSHGRCRGRQAAAAMHALGVDGMSRIRSCPWCPQCVAMHRAVGRARSRRYGRQSYRWPVHLRRAETVIMSAREPAGVLEMLAWSLAVQKAAGLLSPVMPEPAGTGGTAACGAVPPARQDPDVAGELQLTILEVDNIF